LLTGERTALNIMQRMSGVATLTQTYVQAIAGTKAVLLDTRKTMPGMRILDKYAVRVGGGQNHRMRLDDMILIKDNHIALCGGLPAAVKAAQKGGELPVVVECDTLEQVKEALAAAPDRILLDNMDNHSLREAVALSAGSVKLEASGGVALESVREIALTGVDYISVGKITHSAPAVDIAADITFD
jgi:nicotinate-nucleotide pyrophosphorylase (carboxylating)